MIWWVGCAVWIGTSWAVSADLGTARQLVEKEQWTEALEQVDGLLQTHPEDPEGLLLKGVVLARLGKTKESVAIYRSLLTRFPRAPEVYNNLAVILAEQGYRDQGLEVLEWSLEANPAFKALFDNWLRLWEETQGPEGEWRGPGGIKGPLAYVQGWTSQPMPSKSEPTSGSSQVARQMASATDSPPEPLGAGQASGKVAVLPPLSSPDEAREPLATVREPLPASRPSAMATDEPPGDLAGVREMVLAWAEAWAEQRVEDYLQFYSPSFSPPSGEPREAWAEARRARILLPGFIRVAVEGLQIWLEPQGARVEFVQKYSSDNFSDVGQKTFYLSREDGVWKILREDFTPL